MRHVPRPSGAGGGNWAPAPHRPRRSTAAAVPASGARHDLRNCRARGDSRIADETRGAPPRMDSPLLPRMHPHREPPTLPLCCPESISKGETPARARRPRAPTCRCSRAAPGWRGRRASRAPRPPLLDHVSGPGGCCRGLRGAHPLAARAEAPAACPGPACARAPAHAARAFFNPALDEASGAPVHLRCTVPTRAAPHGRAGQSSGLRRRRAPLLVHRGPRATFRRQAPFIQRRARQGHRPSRDARRGAAPAAPRAAPAAARAAGARRAASAICGRPSSCD